MIELMIWAATFAYLVAAIRVARSRIRYWSKKSTFIDTQDGFERGGAAAAALAVGLLWPFSLAFLATRDWLWKPVDRDEARRERLRADLDDWRARTGTGTESDRRMAADIVATLEDLLKGTA